MRISKFIKKQSQKLEKTYLAGIWKFFFLMFFFMSFFGLINFRLLAFSNNLTLPSLPVSPKVPVQKQSEQTQKATAENKETYSKTDAKNEKENTLVEVILGNGKKLKGKIEFPESITFEHQKDNLTYKLTLLKSQLKRIKVQVYNMTVLQRRENIPYSFVPQKVLIETKDGRQYFIDSLFASLKKFTVLTVDGRTTLFSYFADTWKSKGGWTEIGEKNFDAHKTIAHPLAAVEWIFE